MKNKFNISDFSPHLFWDTDKAELDFIKSKEEIKNVVINIRTLDKVTLAFLSQFFNIEKTAFRCYKQNRLNPSFWSS